LENPKTDWVDGTGKTFFIVDVVFEGDLSKSPVDLKSLMTKELLGYNFEGVALLGEADLWVEIRVRALRIQEKRFLPQDHFVYKAQIEAILYQQGEEIPIFRRKALSSPEYSPSKKEAQHRAILNAWRILKPHLMSAFSLY
jgi:hypothetical protein